MAGKRKTNEAGSTNNLRADVLCVLGVLKAATADQIQRLSSPHLTYRHTTKETAAARKEARTASHRGALNDLRRHGLSVDGGRTRGGEEVRLLTKDGLAAAGHELDRGPEEMGGMPKSAGRSGASHAMAVNETVIAMIRPKPDLHLVAGESAEAVAAAQTCVDAPDGIGSIASYATEVALPATGTWRNPGVGCAWADTVLIAPEVGLPLSFIEADNCTEDAARIAGKFDKYMRHFHRTVKDTDGQDKPMWRTRWSAPDPQWGDASHPPVLLVFNQVGKRPALKQMELVAELTREHWQGQWAEGGFRVYMGKMPIVATTLELLREHGPAGPAFWRFGREGRQNLWDAIGNPRRDAALARRAEDARRRRAQETAEREAQRRVCADCGTKFTDDRWKARHRGRLGPRGQPPAPVRRLQGAGARSGAAGRTGRKRAPGARAPGGSGAGLEGRRLARTLAQLTGPDLPAARGLAQPPLGKPSLSVATARLEGMDSDDEQLLRGRIYGTDHDHPGLKPGRSYAELVGGALDGLLLFSELFTDAPVSADGFACWKSRHSGGVASIAALLCRRHPGPGGGRFSP